MKDCNYYLELISAYIDGEISAEDEAELLQHIAECEACKNVLDAYREISGEMEETELEPPEELLNGVMSAVRSGKKRKRITYIWRSVGGLAAVFAVVIAAVALRGGLFSAKSAMDTAAPASNESAKYDMTAKDYGTVDDAEAEPAEAPEAAEEYDMDMAAPEEEVTEYVNDSAEEAPKEAATEKITITVYLKGKETPEGLFDFADANVGTDSGWELIADPERVYEITALLDENGVSYEAVSEEAEEKELVIVIVK